MEFKVWAPNAETLDLHHEEHSSPMQRQKNGWWRIDVAAARPGDDYGFRINGAPPLPDPRSGWQPNGVDGLSRIIDHDAFAWTDCFWQAKPLPSAVIYELHIGTFTSDGTFDAAIERLPHLARLGVTHIEVMPVAEFKGERGWGYDGVCLFAPHHAYGEPDGLKRLIDAAHAQGLALLLDVVYNHLGPTGNRLPQFGPYFTSRHSTPWGRALNFDGPQSDEVRQYFVDNALMWLRDYHFDGLRLDAVHAIVDTSAIPFLEELATAVDALRANLGRHLVLIAESDLNDPRVVRPWQMGGFGLDAQWSDDIHHALHTVLTGECEGYYADFGDLSDLGLAMTQPYVYAGQHSTFRQRRHGRLPLGLTGHAFVAYMQNHDQLGNRAKGDRISSLTSLERVKIGAALYLLSPFVPMLFQGEEWCATSPFQYFVDFHDEPDLAKAVTEGRRGEFAGFGWKPEDIPDPQDAATFRRSKLNWDELAEPRHGEMCQWYQQLIALRRHVSGFTDGRLDLMSSHHDELQKWLVVERGPMTIVCNLADREQTVSICPERSINMLLASSPQVSAISGAVSLPANTVAVLGPLG